MNIKITGRDLTATESIKDYIETKAERLQKYFDTDIELFVTIKKEGDDQVAEMQMSSLRAVTAHKDLYASIDKDIDILEGQIRKVKTKNDKQNMTESIRLKDISLDDENVVEGEIIKTLYYSIKPIGPEDAKVILEGRPQDRFLVFTNIDTRKVNVLYRLKDNKNFGLVEPEA